MNPKDTMMRIVCNNQGNVAVDFSSKMPGRGAYVCKNRECVAKLIKIKGLERAFKKKVLKEVYEILLGEL